MKKNLLISCLLGGAILFSGCTYKNAEVNYKQYHAYSATEAGNFKYKEIGPIYASVSGFAWDECAELTSKVLRDLESKAKALGGDAIIDVKWYGENGLYTIPTCRCGCGWFALDIIGGLGPWVQTAKAEAIAIKFIKDKEDK